MPKIVAVDPIITPTKKKILIIDLFKTPIDFNIAISLVLFFTRIVSPEIILKTNFLFPLYLIMLCYCVQIFICHF